MRIVTGRLRGRTIPFSPKRHGDIRVTSGRLKEAVFDRLGSCLKGLRFLDICAGSGQIALEAYSRGATVTAVEPDRRRRPADLGGLGGMGRAQSISLATHISPRDGYQPETILGCAAP